MGVNRDEPADAPHEADETEGFEVLMSSSGNIHFPGGTPDEGTAVEFLTAAVARQHELLDRFAATMMPEGDEGERTRAGQELGEAITSLQVAAAMQSTAVPTKAGFELAAGDHDHDPTSFYEEDGAYQNVPAGEIPGSVPLHIELVRGDYDVRVRDALVYSTGFLLTVDARLRRDDDRDPQWLGWLDYRLSGRWGSSLTPDTKNAVDYPAGWRTLPAVPGMTQSQWNFWIEMPSGPCDYAFRLTDPISDSFAPWRFSIDAASLAAAQPLS